MLKKIKGKRSSREIGQNSINLWLVMTAAICFSLGCSSLKSKTESPVPVRQLTLADVKNSNDLAAVMKSQKRVKSSPLTKVYNDEKPLIADGEIARVETRYALNWERTDMVNMTVMKFSSAEKAVQYLDGEESSQKSKGETLTRGKKTNGDPTLFFGDGKGLMTFITCKKDFCYSFTDKGYSISAILDSAQFFADYDEQYLAAKN